MKASKSPLRVFQVAYEAARRDLPVYRHKFGPKKLTEPQLIASQTLSEIRRALDAVMSVHFVNRTVRELVAAGRLATRNLLFHRPVNGRGPPITYPYKAAVYEVVKGSGRKGTKKPALAQKPKGPKREAPPKPSGQERPRPGPRAFSEERRQDLRSRILAHLAEHGPSPLSDLRIALAALASETYIDRTVRELVAEGRLSAQKAELTGQVQHEGWVQRNRYRAMVYGLAGTGRGFESQPRDEVPR